MEREPWPAGSDEPDDADPALPDRARGSSVLSNIALEDGFATTFRTLRAIIDPDLDLEV